MLKVATAQKGQLRLTGANLTCIFSHFLRKTVWFYQICSIFPKQAVYCSDLRDGKQKLKNVIQSAMKNFKTHKQRKCIHNLRKHFITDT